MRLIGRNGLAVIAGIVVWGILGKAAQAVSLFTFDVDSLAFMSTEVVEGQVVEAKTVNFINVLTVKVTRCYAGKVKVDEKIVVGLDSFGKVSQVPQTFTQDASGKWILSQPESPKWGVGDSLILFLEPANDAWQKQGIPFWPVGSGVKVIVDDHVTGMSQTRNPGPYENVLQEGATDKFREQLSGVVKAMADFKKELAEKQKDTAWLLDKLKERAAMVKQDRQWGFVRDQIALTLCETLKATGDATSIEQAKTIMTGKAAEVLPSHELP